MSRVGKYPINIPEGVTVEVKDNVVIVKGKLGELCCSFDTSHVATKVENNQIVVSALSESIQSRTLWGTTRANINNLVKGVHDGYTKNLELVGVGYKARMEGTAKLVLSLGFSHDVNFDVPQGVKISCESPTQIKIFGADKQLVGQTAAEIRKYRKPEPYKGKGVKYENEYIRRKEGKKK